MKHHLTSVKHEQFYTDPEVAKFLIKMMDQEIGLNKFDVIVEPSAGTGSFSSNLPHKKAKVFAFDIDPQEKSIKKTDFFKLDTKKFFRAKPSRVLVIGNPPFGNNASLAKRFIKKAATFSDHIAFILPKSFRSDSYMKAVPIDYHVIIDEELDTDIFIYPDTMKKKHLQTVFMYFKKKDYPRDLPQQHVPNKKWNYVEKSNTTERDADFRVVRGAGKVGQCYIKGDKHYKIHSASGTLTDYYIKLKNSSRKEIERVCDKINNHNFVYNNVSKTLMTLNKNQLTKYINGIL